MNESITPREILLEEYLDPMRISQNSMARAIGVSPALYIRFGAFFGQSDEFWRGIQVECDFRKLASDKQKLISGIRSASTLARNSS